MEIKTINEWHNLLLQAENGDTHAMNEVAFIFREGLEIDNAKIVQIDKKEAFNWTKKAYENGDLESMEEYADYLTRSRHVFPARAMSFTT
jgi:TPR repeat protein